MCHKVFCKKFKSSCILTVVAALLLSVTLTTATSIHSAHAADDISADKSAKIKIVFQALTSCFRATEKGFAKNPKDDFKIDSSIIQSDTIRGAYIESIIDKTDDTQSNCGHLLSNGKLEDVLKETGITKEQLYCDYRNTSNYGILRSVDGRACSDAIKNSNDISLKDPSTLRTYLEELFKNKVFDGKVTTKDLYELTDLEKYYAYKTAFTIYCVEPSTSAHFGDTNFNGYEAYVQNPSTGRVELAKYSINNSRRNDKVRVWEYYNANSKAVVYNENYTCSEISNTILGKINSAEVKARVGDQIAGDKKECNDTYDKQYNLINDWVAENGNSLDGNAEADVSTFLSTYKRNGADKWKLESDGITVTCNGLDTMKSKWEDIKKARGLSSAPSVDSSVPYASQGTVESDDQGKGDTTTCSSASGAVGWFICPILEFAASTSVKIYEDFIEPSLETNPELFKTEGKYNGTYQAWQTFRDVANIAFAIFLLFIIFSQVTGIGIDNYGIKKSLPKLIIAVILVNISFYICQFLIDISNIAGSSLYGLINGIGDKITVPAVYGQTLKYASSVTFSIFALVAGGAAVAAFWSAIAGALLAAIPTLIGALVGILFFFFLLGMRQTIVVLLVAISPLAFVCYALPNTKNLFDRWSQLLRSMLILYPICSLMVAGGRLVSKIVLASGGAGSGSSLFFILVAMIAEIGPLFMIPSITRSAFQATGQLGTALSGLRGRMTGGARNIARNNKALQRAVTRNQRNRANSWAARRRVNNYNASAAKNPNNRSLRDRWNLRRGNQEHVAAINQASLAADEERRKIDQMSNAQQVAGLRAGAQLTHAQAVGRNQYLGNMTPEELKNAEEAATAQAATSAEEQNIRNANYGDAEFARAVIRQAETENNSAKERQMLWNRDGYREGKENANTAALTSELETTRLWTHEDYIKGKLAESGLSREGEQKRAELYANEDYIKSRQKAQQAVISNEITKMYSDQFSRMGMSEIQSHLEDCLKNGGENHTERFAAAVSALVQAGQADKAREVLAGDKTYSEAARGFGKMLQDSSDEGRDFRNKAAQVLGSSGEFTFQEFAKHIGTEGKKARSFKEWADADIDERDGSGKLVNEGRCLASSLRDKGLDRIDKDGFGFLALHAKALKGASSDNISKVAASTTDAATIAKLASAIGELDLTTRKKIIEATSADRFVNMNETIRATISGNNDALWRDKVGNAIRDNPQIAARLSTEQYGRYASPEPVTTTTPSSSSSTTSPTPPPRSDAPRPPRDTNPDDYSGDGGF